MSAPTDPVGFADLTWIPIQQVYQAAPSGEVNPHATHWAELVVFGRRLRCIQLSDGSRTIDANDLAAFFDSPGVDIDAVHKKYRP